MNFHNPMTQAPLNNLCLLMKNLREKEVKWFVHSQTSVWLQQKCQLSNPGSLTFKTPVLLLSLKANNVLSEREMIIKGTFKNSYSVLVTSYIVTWLLCARHIARCFMELPHLATIIRGWKIRKQRCKEAK